MSNQTSKTQLQKTNSKTRKNSKKKSSKTTQSKRKSNSKTKSRRKTSSKKKSDSKSKTKTSRSKNKTKKTSKKKNKPKISKQKSKSKTKKSKSKSTPNINKNSADHLGIMKTKLSLMDEKRNKVRTREWIPDPQFHHVQQKGVWGIFRRLYCHKNKTEGDPTELENMSPSAPAPKLVAVNNAICLLCRGIYAYQGTSNLHRHLVIAHLPFIHENLEHRDLLIQYLGMAWISNSKNQKMVIKRQTSTSKTKPTIASKKMCILNKTKIGTIWNKVVRAMISMNCANTAAENLQLHQLLEVVYTYILYIFMCNQMYIYIYVNFALCKF